MNVTYIYIVQIPNMISVVDNPGINLAMNPATPSRNCMYVEASVTQPCNMNNQQIMKPPNCSVT